MFGAILLIEDPVARAAIEQLAIESLQVSIHHSCDRLPSPYELARLLDSYDPDLLFVDLTDWSRGLTVAGAAAMHSRRTAVIGYARRALHVPPEIAALLTPPLSVESLDAAVRAAIGKTRLRSRHDLDSSIC
jgi:hypothetical protein